MVGARVACAAGGMTYPYCALRVDLRLVRALAGKGLQLDGVYNCAGADAVYEPRHQRPVPGSRVPVRRHAPGRVLLVVVEALSRYHLAAQVRMRDVRAVIDQGHPDRAESRVRDLFTEGPDLPEVRGELLHALHPHVGLAGLAHGAPGRSPERLRVMYTGLGSRFGPRLTKP